MTPDVSVLLPVYNGSRTLARTVASMLDQTFLRFEILAIDDDSGDDSRAILAGFEGDERVRVLSNDSNLGLVGTLNRGLHEARGELIARIDQDDWSSSTRLARQVEMFDGPEVGLVATAFERVDQSGLRLRTVVPPLSHAGLAASMMIGNRILHSSVMFRRRTALDVGGYNEAWLLAEDYDLWLRIIAVSEYRCVASVETSYTQNPDGMSSKRSVEQAALASRRAFLYRSDLAGGDRDGMDESPTPRSIARGASALRTRLRQRGIATADLDRYALRAAGAILSDNPRFVRTVRIALVAPRLALLGRLPTKRFSGPRLAEDSS